jgi:putative N6-adenine-specific DNA methylase
MCGSGTIPVEAGLIACKIPPGKFRKFFGFTKWKNFDEELFEKVRHAADDQITDCTVRISASDISGKAVTEAIENVKNSGLEKAVALSVSDIRDVNIADDPGHVLINPPYGQRIAAEDPASLYGLIGTTMKHNFTGSRVWIITAAMDYIRYIGLRPKSKQVLFNGALESLLLEYEIYQGSKRNRNNLQST